MKGFSQLAENGHTDQFHAGYKVCMNISQFYILQRKESVSSTAGSRILEHTTDYDTWAWLRKAVPTKDGLILPFTHAETCSSILLRPQINLNYPQLVANMHIPTGAQMALSLKSVGRFKAKSVGSQKVSDPWWYISNVLTIPLTHTWTHHSVCNASKLQQYLENMLLKMIKRTCLGGICQTCCLLSVKNKMICDTKCNNLVEVTL